MLTILFGVSGVGKSSLIRELRNEFGWSSIPTYMTRSLRPGETEKISVSEPDFAKMENEDLFVCVNQIFGNKYGTPRKEIEIAVHDQESYWVLDFPISKMALPGLG
jgi:guanylate kinase